MLKQPEMDTERLLLDDILTPEQQLWIPKRADLWLRCEDNDKYKAATFLACQKGTPDMPGYLFWCYYFAHIFEQRNDPGLQKLPCIPYGYQIDELAVIHRAVQGGMGVLGARALILWLKSRDMGLTWIVLLYFLWDWLFNRGIFHLGSRNDNEVDKLGDMGTLFQKLRFCLYALPKWQIPPDLKDNNKLLSYSNGEVAITGETANSGFGRSKRFKAVAMDELQKWEHDRSAVRAIQGSTNCLLVIGTPEGYGNYYSELANKKAKGVQVEVRRVHWRMHPLKSRGEYMENGRWTSPWFKEYTKTMTAIEIAGELELSFESSALGPLFSQTYGKGHQKTGLKPIPGLPILRCWDPGGWFACVFIQIDRYRRVHVYREVILEGLLLGDAVEEVLRVSEELARSAAGDDWEDAFVFEDCGDPSGSYTSKMNQVVPEYDELATKHNIFVDYLFMGAMPTELRKDARHIQIENAMKYHVGSQNEEIDGPGFWVDVDHCPIIDEALKGGYKWKTRDGKLIPVIEENHPYNDAIDALGYGVVYKLGVPEAIRNRNRRRTEEEEEDEEEAASPRRHRRRRRC